VTDRLSRRAFLAAAGTPLLAGPLLARPIARGATAAPGGGPAASSPLAAVDYRRVRLADPFWAPRQRVNREVTVPHLFAQLRENGYASNLERAAAGQTGGYRGFVFADSDVHKSLEAAAYCLGSGPDARISASVDEWIQLLRAAQRPDGYLDTAYLVQGKTRFTNLRDDHELYCLGHLIEAGVALRDATGRRDLLEIAVPYADLVEATFGDGPGKRPGYCGHPEIELALVRLSRLTGDRKYFRLAQSFLEHRGEKFFAAEHKTPLDRYDGTYWLDDVHLREHQVISGHAVRALYFYSAALDVAAETHDAETLAAVERVWRNATDRRMFVTGGLGSSAHNEGFTDDYDLPTFSAYQETCASIAFVYLSHRLNRATGEARYADMVEWALYNAVAAGVSLSGDRFFYVNPLASHGSHHRKAWYDCACCPPNVARLVATLGGYAYATGERDVFLNLYLAGSADVDLPKGRVRLEVDSQYPWDGRVTLNVRESTAGEFALRLRVPGWCDGTVGLKVNGEAPAARREKGYLVLSRAWRGGDRVELDLPMPIRRLRGHPLIEDTADRVALSRGPIVYCVEQADTAAPLPTLRLPQGAGLRPERSDLLGGVTVLRGAAAALAVPSERRLYADAPGSEGAAELVAVPYCTWDNRQAGPMRVWLATA
jgi:uncharacterized protein